MRTFLGVIMVLIVSGDCETVSGILNGSVLLPCSCPERDVNKPFYWQMESPKVMLVFKYSNGTSTFKDRYKGRGKIFLPEHGNNCSVLLTNVTADDQGEYRCIFNSQGLHRKIFVNLNVSASYTVCQDFTECHVKGRYRDAEIEWDLDGRPLTSSPTTNITLDDSTGLYHFTSKLITSLSGTSSPTCTVKAKGVSTTIITDCKTETEKITDNKMPLRYRCLKIIPIVSVLGFFLVLWRRLKFSELGLDGTLTVTVYEEVCLHMIPAWTSKVNTFPLLNSGNWESYCMVVDDQPITGLKQGSTPNFEASKLKKRKLQ